MKTNVCMHAYFTYVWGHMLRTNRVCHMNIFVREASLHKSFPLPATPHRKQCVCIGICIVRVIIKSSPGIGRRTCCAIQVDMEDGLETAWM